MEQITTTAWRELIIQQLMQAHIRHPNGDGHARAGDHALNPSLKPGSEPTPAAVLIPLVAHESGPTVLLTQRTDHLHHHAGQICFPGGRQEAHDLDLAGTALRETEEEIGLPAGRVEIIAHLADYLTATGFMITPVVGWVEPGFTLVPDEFEVAEIFEVPLSFFLNDDNYRLHNWAHQGINRTFYALDYQDHFIWGATAGILHDFSRQLQPVASALTVSI